MFQKSVLVISYLFMLSGLLSGCSSSKTCGNVNSFADSSLNDNSSLYGAYGPVFFAYDRSDLSQEAKDNLTKQAEAMLANSNAVTLEGHCDDRGTREYNLALGERRAQSVKKYLVSMGVPASRITTISYGKERPAVLGHDEYSHAQNRRVVTK